MCVWWGQLHLVTSTTQTGLLSAFRLEEIWGELSPPQQRRDADSDKRMRNCCQCHLSEWLPTWIWVEVNSSVQFTCCKYLFLVKCSSGWSQERVISGRDSMKIPSLISAEVTASSAQAGLLSHRQYLPRVLKDSQHVPATISLHASSL